MRDRDGWEKHLQGWGPPREGEVDGDGRQRGRDQSDQYGGEEEVMDNWKPKRSVIWKQQVL